MPESTDPVRLDLYLSKRFSYLSRSAWQKEITLGKVYINGEAVLNLKKRVHAGFRIQYMAGFVKEPEIDDSFTIIYEDDHYIAINKTGNLPVHPSGIFFHHTLVSLLEAEYNRKFFPIHRLDRETSGAILFGKNNEAASAVQSAFENVNKTYTAITRGKIEEKEFDVDIPLGQARDSLIRKKREAYEGAPEYSLTKFTVISSSSNYSLVKAVPVTGRTHQIRAHLSYAGFPVLGDKIYGPDEKLYLRYVQEGDSDDLALDAGFARCALHSSSIEFYHPYRERVIEVHAPLLPDMQDFISRENL